MTQESTSAESAASTKSTKKVMTEAEQAAVKQHLSKNRPYDGGGCGCLGIQPVSGSRRVMDSFTEHYIKVIDFGETPLMVVRALRDKLGLTLPEALAAKNAGSYLSKELDWAGTQTDLAIYLQEVGATVERISTGTPMDPLCPCSMRWVEEVDGIYYHITEERSPEGITVLARTLGPKGGPYINL